MKNIAGWKSVDAYEQRAGWTSLREMFEGDVGRQEGILRLRAECYRGPKEARSESNLAPVVRNLREPYDLPRRFDGEGTPYGITASASCGVLAGGYKSEYLRQNLWR